MLQVRKFNILCCLSHLYFYTHSIHFSFQVRFVSALLPLLLLHSMVDSSELAFIIGYYYLDNPLDRVLQTFVLLHI